MILYVAWVGGVPLSDYIRPIQSAGVLSWPLTLRRTLTPGSGLVPGVRWKRSRNCAIFVQPALTRAS